MRALKRHKTEFWGQEYTVRPMLLDAVFGDGKEFVWFEYMDDRPYYYVARVPTGTRKEKGYPDVIEDIEESIRDEAMYFYSELAWREHDRKGYVSTNRRWPIPPDMASGSAWGAYEPPKHVLAMCNSELRRATSDLYETQTFKEKAHPMTAAPKPSASKKTVNAAVIAGAAPCSEFEVEVLKVIAASRGNVNASWLAAKMWPQAKGKWFGARSGRWQRIGAILQRLHNRKLLWREVTEHNQKLWTISTEGQRVADTPND